MLQSNSTASPRFAQASVCVFLFLLPLAVYPYSMLPTVDIKWLLIGAGAFVLPLLSGTLRAETRFTVLRLPVVVLGAMVVWALIGGISADNRGLALIESARLISYALLFMCASAAFSTPRQLEMALTCFVVSMAVVSIYGFVQWAGLDPLPWDPSVMNTDEFRNLPSTLGNPNIAGHALTVSILSAVTLARVRGQWWLLGIAALNIAHLVLTRHRAGMAALIAAAVFAIVIVWTSRGKGSAIRRALRALLTTISIGAVGIGLLLAAHYAARDSIIPREQSLLLRINSVYGSARMVMEKPLLGFGLGHYEIANVPYWTPFERENFARAGRYNTHAHNEYANFAAEAGFPSALLYVTLLTLMIFRGLTTAMSGADKEHRGAGFICAIIFFAFAIDGIFGFNFRAPVSGASFAILAGAFEGVLGTRRDLSATGGRMTWVACIALGAGCAILAGATFVSQRDLLRVKGAIAWEQPLEAARYLDHGSRMAPWNWRFPLEAGDQSLQRGEWQEAITAYHRARELHPNSLTAIMGLARAAIMHAGLVSNVEQADAVLRATSYLKEAEALCPNWPDIAEVRGNAAMVLAANSNSDARVAHLKTAGDQYLEAIAKGAADRAKLYHATAITMLELGEADSALAYQTRAIQEPTAREPVLDAFLALSEQQGAFDAADKTLADLRARLGRQADADLRYRALISCGLGILRTKRGAGAEETLPLFEEAVAIDPLLARAWEMYYRVAEANQLLERFQKTFVREMSEAEGAWPATCVAVGHLLIISPSDVPGALHVLHNALTSDDPYRPSPKDARLAWAMHITGHFFPDTAEPELKMKAAILFARTGRPIDTLRYLDAAGMDLPPDAKRAALRERIYALIGLGKPVEAEQLVRTGLAATPTDPELLLALPRTLVKQGRADEARFEYELLSNSISRDSPIHALIAEDLRELEARLSS